MNLSRNLAFCLVLFGLLLFASPNRADDDSPSIPIPEPTHKQIRVFEPRHDGQKIHLNTFCLDLSGNIVVAVGGNNGFIGETGENPGGTEKPSHFIQTYSPEWTLLSELPLDFQPTAINFDSAGYLYVGGDSVLCKFSPGGDLVQRSLTPNLAGLSEDDLRAEAKKALEAQAKQMSEIYEQQIEQIRSALEKLDADAKSQSESDSAESQNPPSAAGDSTEGGNENPSQEDNPFLGQDRESLKEMLEQMTSSFEQIKAQFAASPERIESMVRQMGHVNSIGIGQEDVFVTCQATQGFGYEIWRVNRDLGEPKKVKANLAGCCGQLDIQSDGENLLIAENTRFRVGIYDREGKPLRSFGQQDRNGESGFGSCCNPMNIRCCSNGDVLTAESSIGTIKRFDASGKLLGNIGRAKISGGCKHVALAHDEKRDRYYMQYQDASTICVLVPKSEVQGETEEEKAAREARDGLARKLIGQWNVAAAEKADPNTPVDYYQFDSVSFEAEGKMLATAKRPVFGENTTWEPIKQSDNRLTLGLFQDKVELFQLAVDFEQDNRIHIGLVYGAGQPNWLGTFVRREAEAARDSGARQESDQ